MSNTPSTQTDFSLTPTQRIVVRTWFQLLAKHGSEPVTDDEYDERYGPIDYLTAHKLDMPVERVGEALVAAGKRPPLWWIG